MFWKNFFYKTGYGFGFGSGMGLSYWMFRKESYPLFALETSEKVSDT